MLVQTTRYGLSRVVRLPYEEAVERTRQELGKEGFGVLTEIDVKATLKKKLDADFRPYVILGACNPPFAYQALQVERDIGLLLPCNVVVYAGDEPGTSVVAMLDPEELMKLTEGEGVAPVAAAVKKKLERALEALGE